MCQLCHTCCESRAKQFGNLFSDNLIGVRKYNVHGTEGNYLAREDFTWYWIKLRYEEENP
jgi:hypothetical protein